MTSKFRQTLESCAYPGALALVALLALTPSWFKGEIPMSVDYIYTLPPWSDQAPQEVSPHLAEATRLQALQYYPWYAFLSRSVSSGDSLLWNPLEGCGIPFMAIWKSRCFSPFSLPFYVLPLHTALTVSALLKLFVAGLCAFYAAKRFGLVRPFALSVAVTYQLCAHVMGCLDTPMSDVTPWLPLLFLFVELLVTGHWALWPLGCLTWTLMLFGGDPVMAVMVAVAAFLFLLTRSSVGRLHPGLTAGSAAVFLMSLAVGTAMAAIQLLPYIELLYEAVQLGHDTPRNAVSWLFWVALLFGDASVSESNNGLTLSFLGYLPVVFVPLWFVLRRFSSAQLRLRVDGMVLAAALFSALGVVASAMPEGLPLVQPLRLEHFLVANVFALGLLCGASAQRWLTLTAPQVTHTLPRFLVTLGVALAAVALVVLVAGLWGPTGIVPPWTRLWFAALVWIIAIALLGVTLVRPSPEILGWGMTGLGVFGSLMVAPTHVRFSEATRLFPSTPAIEAIAQADHRMAGSPALKSWPIAAHGIAQFYSSSGIVLKRHHLFATQLENGKPLLVRKIGTPWLVLAGEDTLGPFSGMRPALKRQMAFKGGLAVFEDMEAQDAAKLWYVGRAISDVDANLLDPALPPLMETTVAPAQPAEDGATVTLTPPSRNVYRRYAVETTRPGVLVVADAWYPGWKVRIDGEEKELFPVDIMFRGVAIGAGAHTVEIFYDPVTVELGMGISTTATLIAAVGLLLPILSRYRQTSSK